MSVPCKKRNILVIGGTGRLGRLIFYYLKKANHDVIYTHHKNGFADSLKFNFFKDNVEDLPGFNDIEIIIFAAKVEFEKDSGKLERAMRRFIKKCEKKRILYISSDAVFDGNKKGGLYSQWNEVCPNNQYGRNLVLCENIIEDSCESSCVIRPCSLYGYSLGELDPRLSEARQLLLSGREYRRYDDMYRSFLSYHQTASIIARFSLLIWTGTYHLSGRRFSVYDFTFRAMKALKVPTEKLIRGKMPADPDLLKDTSLKTEVLLKFCAEKPWSLIKSLKIL